MLEVIISLWLLFIVMSAPFSGFFESGFPG